MCLICEDSATGRNISRLSKANATLTIICIMFKNGQRYFKNLAIGTPQDLESIFDHFSTLCITSQACSKLSDWITSLLLIFTISEYLALDVPPKHRT